MNLYPSKIKNPTLSVTMCNYNYGKYIGEALEAILTQSFSPAEVIVVDDGSTDNSVEVIRYYLNKYPNLRLLQNEKNMGIHYSTKRCFDEVSGDYLYATASDDKVLPGFFEKSMNLLLKYPQAGLCCADIMLLYESGDIVERNEGISKKPLYISPSEVVELFSRTTLPPISPYTVIVKRAALIEAGGYIPELKWTIDLFAHNVISARYGFCYIPEALTRVRVGRNSYGNVAGRWRDDRKIIMKAIELVKSPRYKDVLPMFRKAAPFSQSSWEVLMVVLGNRKYWDFLSLRLVRLALFDKFVKRVLGGILPGHLYSKIAVKVKQFIRMMSSRRNI